MTGKLELNDEERVALGKAFDWMEEDGADWRKMDEGYYEACVLALLLAKFSQTIMEDMKRIVHHA